MQNKDQAIMNAMRMAESHDGKQLIQKLKEKDSRALDQAVKYATTGDYAQAQKLLRELINDPDIQRLLNTIGR